jgi:hypothetical protein
MNESLKSQHTYETIVKNKDTCEKVKDFVKTDVKSQDTYVMEVKS